MIHTHERQLCPSGRYSQFSNKVSSTNCSNRGKGALSCGGAPKKGPSSAACASQWRQPGPLAMTQMRWPTEASEHGRRRGVSPVALVVPAFAHTKSPGSSPRPRVLSCLVSCHLRDVAGESRRLVDNRVEGLEQADTSSRMNTAILGAFFLDLPPASRPHRENHHTSPATW